MGQKSKIASEVVNYPLKVQRRLIGLYDNYQSYLSKAEFLSIVQSHTTKNDEAVTTCATCDWDLIRHEVKEAVLKNNSKVIDNTINYIKNYFNDKIWTNSVLRDLGMLQSYLLSKKITFTVDMWEEVLERSPKLDTTLASFLHKSEIVLDKCEMNKIQPHIFMHYLVIAYAKKHNIPLKIDNSSQYYDSLVLKSEDLKEQLKEIQLNYSLGIEDLKWLLNLLRRYLKIDEILNFLPYILEEISLDDTMPNIIENILEEIIAFKLDLKRLNKSAENNQAVYRDIYDYTKIPKDTLDALIKKLPLASRHALQHLFGICYTDYILHPKWKSVNQKNLCFKTLDSIKESYDLSCSSKRKNHQPERERAKTIDAVLNIRLSICLVAINKLNESDLRIIKYMFGNDFKEVYDDKKLLNDTYRKEYTNAMQKLRGLITVVTLYDYLEIPEENLRHCLVKVPANLRKSLFLQWNNFSYRYIPYVNLAKEDKENIVKAYKLLKKLSNNFNKNSKPSKRVQKVKSVQTIYEYFNTTKEKLDPILERLSIEKQLILKKKFGDDYCIVQSRINWENEQERKLCYQIIMNIKYHLEKDQNISIYDYFKAPKEVLDPIIEDLSWEKKQVLIKKFGKNYDKMVLLTKWESKEEAQVFYSLVAFIKYQLNNMNQKEERLNVTIYEYFNTTKEELDPILERLPFEKKQILKQKFGDDYATVKKRMQWQNKKERNLFNSTVVKIKKSLKTPPANITIYDYFKTTKEELDSIIESLPLEKKQILQIKFGKDYLELVPLVRWPEERGSVLFNQIANSIKFKLKNKNQNAENKIAMHEYLGVTKEELDLVLESLPFERKQLLKKKFGDNYDNLHKRYKWENEEEETTYNRTMFLIRKKLKENPDISIYEFLGAEKEVLDSLIAKLSEEERKALKKKFGQDYTCYVPKINWETKEEQVLYSKAYLTLKRGVKKYYRPQELQEKYTKQITDLILVIRDSEWQNIFDYLSLQEVIVLFLLMKGYSPKEVADFANILPEEVEIIQKNYQELNAKMLNDLANNQIQKLSRKNQ